MKEKYGKGQQKGAAWYITGLIGLLVLIALDQWTKHLAVLHLKDQPDIILIPGKQRRGFWHPAEPAVGVYPAVRGVFDFYHLVLPAPAKAKPLSAAGGAGGGHCRGSGGKSDRSDSPELCGRFLLCFLHRLPRF